VNILRFEMNVPTNVAIEASEGVPVEGRYGNRMRFNLTDGRVMYVPSIVASKIEAAGIVPGERFELCKSLVRTGQRRSVEWLVERISPGQDREPGDEGVATGTAETSLEHDLRLSIELANANAGFESPPNCLEEFTAAGSPPVSNGNGGAPKVNPPKPAPPVTQLEHALKTAISAAHNAEKFGTELGYVVRFDADAIKSMAITVLINMSERSAR
jgi:hypothetical protein